MTRVGVYKAVGVWSAHRSGEVVVRGGKGHCRIGRSIRCQESKTRKAVCADLVSGIEEHPSSRADYCFPSWNASSRPRGSESWRDVVPGGVPQTRPARSKCERCRIIDAAEYRVR